ncbi:MAG: hypothetical protein ABSD46_13570 [Bacteroidota bacterium]
MNILFSTPRNRRTILIAGVLLILARPFIDIVGAYNAITGDVYIAIGIDALTPTPIFWSLFTLIIYSPMILILWIGLRTYPGRLSLIYFNTKRPYWSTAWTILFVAAIALAISSMFNVNRYSRIPNLERLHDFLWALYLLWVRVAVINSNIFMLPPNQALKLTE